MPSAPPPRTALPVLVALSVCHLLNDLLQSLLPALYPLLKDRYSLDFWHIGMITLANQVTSSLLQPVVGHYTDSRPHPYSLSVGMGFTLTGLLVLATAHTYVWLLAAAALVGVGSSIFHRSGIFESPAPAAAALRRSGRHESYQRQVASGRMRHNSHATGPANRMLSSRSSSPPKPGKIAAESFLPMSRFSSDSHKSPTRPASPTSTP
jgi:MFS family permease